MQNSWKREISGKTVQKHCMHFNRMISQIYPSKTRVCTCFSIWIILNEKCQLIVAGRGWVNMDKDEGWKYHGALKKINLFTYLPIYSLLCSLLRLLNGYIKKIESFFLECRSQRFFITKFPTTFHNQNVQSISINMEIPSPGFVASVFYQVKLDENFPYT